MLIDGKWSGSWQPTEDKSGDGKSGDGKSGDGSFQRRASLFRNWVTRDGAPGPTGAGGFKAEAGRYHLYVALACPWASRTLIVRRLKKLEAALPVSVVEPEISDQGWRFGSERGATPDPIRGATYLHEIYTLADPGYTGRVTVPVLWDKRQDTIVSNESADIVRMMNDGFGDLAAAAPDLCPADLRAGIDALNDEIYASLNNGVYRAGFAQSQGAYEAACREVFATLDRLESRLGRGGPYLFGERLTETDVRLFVTLVRFDAAYHGLFRCNLRRLADYPALGSYAERMLALPEVRDTVSLDHIKRGYYAIRSLNPSGIVPLGPDLPAAFPR